MTENSFKRKFTRVVASRDSSTLSTALLSFHIHHFASMELFFSQEFATENWRAERERHGVQGKRGQDVWPFIFMMDDSCGMWQNLLKQSAKR